MRLQRLSMDRFGHFTDRQLDFGSGGDDHDFHIVYGPNEAGKTTTMEAVLRLFYGFPVRDGYAFKHQRNNLQISATLEIDGVLRHFTRLPARNGSLVDHAGAALPEAALGSHLAGLSEQDYRRLLCLDDDTIERGGEEIANAEGDIGRLLFSAAAGVADLSHVLDDVREKAEVIWKQNGRKHRVAELKRELADLDKEIRERDVTASAWKSLKRELGKANASEAEARKSRDALIEAKALTEAQKRSLPLMAEIRSLEDAVAPWGHYPDQLDFDPEQLIELRSQRGISVQNIDRLTVELETLKKERSELSVDTACLRLAATLRSLDDLAARNRTAVLDMDRRVDEIASAQADMVRAARDLGVPAANGELEALVVSPAAIGKLESQREALRTAIAAEEIEDREIKELTDRVDRANEALEDLIPAHPDVPSISHILVRHDADGLAPRYAAAMQAIASAKAKYAHSLSELSVAHVTFDQLPVCPTSRHQVAEWADSFHELQRDLKDVTAKRDDRLADAASRKAQIERISFGERVISDAEADTLRSTRDARWEEHLAALDKASAERFHEAMLAQDQSANARLSHSKELAQLREFEHAETDALVRAAELDKRLANLREDCSRIIGAVSSAARLIGLPDEMVPGELLDWVDRFESAKAEKSNLVEVDALNASVMNDAEALLAKISAVLSDAPPDFEQALRMARSASVEEREQAEVDRKADDALRQARSDLKQRQLRQTETARIKAEAEAAWTDLVENLFGNAIAPDNLEASLEPLRLMREHETARATAERRVEAMRADQRQFCEEVNSLAKAYQLEPKSDTAETFSALKDISERAQSDKDAVEKIDARIVEIESELAGHADRRDAVDQQVSAIAAVFPDPETLNDIDKLRQVVVRAEKLIERRASLEKLISQVLSDLGAADIKDAQTLLADVTSAALGAALESNASDLALAEEELTRAIQAHVRARQALDEITGDDSVAALVERRATLELQLEEAALEHLELSLGHRLASEAIRRYRDSHRSGMLTATERCFAELTQGAYPSLSAQIDKEAEVLLAVDRSGLSKRASEMSKGTRFQLYLALRAAAHEQLVSQGTILPFFCDDIFETFDETRTSAACRVMEAIGSRGQAIYLTHHRHVVEIAKSVCTKTPIIHEL